MKNKTGVQSKQKVMRDDYVTRELLAESLGKDTISKEEVELLSELLKDKESIVRSAAINSFWRIGKKKYISRILPLLNDCNEVVRVDAVECLAALGGKSASSVLLQHINDRSEIVRMYIGTCLGEIGDHTVIERIENALKEEHSSLAKVGLLQGLILLGKQERLLDILSLLKCRRYQVRCATANSLIDLVCKENKKNINEALTIALRKENTLAVKSSIEKALRSI